MTFNLSSRVRHLQPMAWTLDLDWVRKAGKNDDNEEDDRVVKNVLQVTCGVLHRGVYLPLTPL